MNSILLNPNFRMNIYKVKAKAKDKIFHGQILFCSLRISVEEI
jgi:hypothetical protein